MDEEFQNQYAVQLLILTLGNFCTVHVAPYIYVEITIVLFLELADKAMNQ